MPAEWSMSPAQELNGDRNRPVRCNYSTASFSGGDVLVDEAAEAVVSADRSC